MMPSYNEEANLPVNVPKLAAKLDALGVSFEIVIVDDASRDGTLAVANELAARDPRVRVLRHPVNRGIGGGFVSAVRAARGEFCILIPADLALDLDQLPKYLDAARNHDVVVGCRSSRNDYTLFRKLVSVVNIGLVQLLFRMRQRQFQYISLYRTAFLQSIRLDYTRSAFLLPEVIIKARDRGLRLTEVEIGYMPRQTGEQTGARPKLIAATVRDMLHFWFRRRFGRYRH